MPPCADSSLTAVSLNEAQPRASQLRYKVSLCWRHAQGFCGKGARCTFAHGLEDLHMVWRPVRRTIPESGVEIEDAGSSTGSPSTFPCCSRSSSLELVEPEEVSTEQPSTAVLKADRPPRHEKLMKWLSGQFLLRNAESLGTLVLAWRKLTVEVREAKERQREGCERALRQAHMAAAKISRCKTDLMLHKALSSWSRATCDAQHEKMVSKERQSVKDLKAERQKRHCLMLKCFSKLLCKEELALKGTVLGAWKQVLVKEKEAKKRREKGFQMMSRQAKLLEMVTVAPMFQAWKLQQMHAVDGHLAALASSFDKLMVEKNVMTPELVQVINDTIDARKAEIRKMGRDFNLPPPSVVEMEEEAEKDVRAELQHAPRRQVLLKGLSQAGLRLEVMPSDGACFFRSVAAASSVWTAAGLRVAAVKEALASWVKCSGGDTVGRQNWSAQMLNPCTFADHIALRGASCAIKRPIWVFSPSGVVKVPGAGEPVLVCYNGLNHYDLLRRV